MHTKLILATVITAISILSLHGQGLNHVKRFNLGAQGGIQFTNLKSFASPYSPQSRTGFYAGIFGEYNISKSFKVRLGLQYDSRSFELYAYQPFTDTTNTFNGSYYLYQTTYTVNYLTIPLNLNFVRGNDKFKIYLQAGLYYSIYLNAKQKGVEGYYMDPDDKIDLSETILHTGANEFTLDGQTDGTSFVNISKTESVPGNESYEVINFNFYDFGFNFFLGLIYQPTPSIGLTIGPGFSYSFVNAFEDPAFNYGWSQITRVNLGFIYTLNVYKKGFGQQ